MLLLLPPVAAALHAIAAQSASPVARGGVAALAGSEGGNSECGGVTWLDEQPLRGSIAYSWLSTPADESSDLDDLKGQSMLQVEAVLGVDTTGATVCLSNALSFDPLDDRLEGCARGGLNCVAPGGGLGGQLGSSGAPHAPGARRSPP